MSDELKPCPFCGAPVNLEETIDTYPDHLYGYRKWWGVVCRSTLNARGSCAIHQRPSASKEAAIERWNHRAISLELEQAIAAKDAEILRLHTRLAGETLRADQGWARYEAANRMCQHQQAEIASLKRVPLSEMQIASIYALWDKKPGASFGDLFRAVEAAHGIGGAKNDHDGPESRANAENTVVPKVGISRGADQFFKPAQRPYIDAVGAKASLRAEGDHK